MAGRRLATYSSWYLLSLCPVRAKAPQREQRPFALAEVIRCVLTVLIRSSGKTTPIGSTLTASEDGSSKEACEKRRDGYEKWAHPLSLLSERGLFSAEVPAAS